jgi:endonuclease/exonuclease/phosphatase family metal-dependent hydrolase
MRFLRAVWPRAGTAVAVAGAAIVSTAMLFAGGTNAAAGRQTYLQLNMCGNACNHGGLAVVGNLVGIIAAGKPSAVTLNEVCENQYDRLRADLRAYHGRFDPTGPTCSNGSRYGNAVLVHTPGVDLVGSWQLPNPAGDETRRLMCLNTRPPGTSSLVVCVTHISNVQANIAAQIDAIAALLHALGGTHAVLLGGDFNTDPADARLNSLYSTCYSSGTGAFEEADSAGCGSRVTTQTRRSTDVLNEDTFHRHKLDYIFLSDGHWSTARASTVDAANGLSDHDALWATATFRG